jgi:hypothetical protein
MCRLASPSRGDGVPAFPAVVRALQPNLRRQVFAGVRMSGGEEAVVAGDGEAHQVVVQGADARGLRLAFRCPPQPAVCGDVEVAVAGVDAEAVHVLRAGVGDEAVVAGGRGVVVTAAAARDSDGDDDEDEQKESGHHGGRESGRVKRAK